MSEDSFCAEWIEFDEDKGLMTTYECIFILDDSICIGEVINYLKREIEDYFIENQNKLQARCDRFAECFSFGKINEKRILNDIRIFAADKSIDHIVESYDLNTFIAVIKMFKIRWINSKRLFSKNGKAYKWQAVLYKVYLLLFMYTGLSTFTEFGLFGFVVGFVAMPTLYTLISKTHSDFLKIVNSSVFSELEQTIGPERYGSISFDNMYDHKPSNEEKLSLLELIKSDIAIMKNHGNIDFTDEINGLSRLSKEYSYMSVSSEHGDILKFLNWLIDLEENMFRKIKERSEGYYLLDRDNLEKRLAVLGYNKGSYEDNQIFSLVVDTLMVLNESPFRGCEVEALRLFRIAITGVDESITYGESFDNLEKSIQVICEKIYVCQKAAVEVDEIERSLDELKEQTIHNETPRIAFRPVENAGGR